MFLSEIGTSFVDVLSGAVVLVALVMAFQGVREGMQAPRQMLLIGVSGLALRALGGIKVVNLPFTILIALFAWSALIFGSMGPRRESWSNSSPPVEAGHSGERDDCDKLLPLLNCNRARSYQT